VGARHYRARRHFLCGPFLVAKYTHDRQNAEQAFFFLL
jgi:hypothetical protein